jgi:hypothetical protein
LDDGAQRFVCVFDAPLCSGDHGIHRIADRLLRYIGFAELKPIPQHRDVARVFTQLIDITLRFIAESFEQQTAEMFRRDNLRALRVNLPIANPDLIDSVH